MARAKACGDWQLGAWWRAVGRAPWQPGLQPALQPLTPSRVLRALRRRSMRHLDMQRLRCDIKDFDVAQVRRSEKE